MFASEIISFSVVPILKYKNALWLIMAKIKQATRLIFFFKILQEIYNKTMQKNTDTLMINPSRVKLFILEETKNSRAINNPFLFKRSIAKAIATKKGFISCKIFALPRTRKHSKSPKCSKTSFLCLKNHSLKRFIAKV